MKKILLVVGIVIIVACVVSLIIAAWNLFAYHHVLDGSAVLYGRLHRRMQLAFAAGIVFAVIGAVCMIIRSRI